MHNLPIIRDTNGDLASERELHPGVKVTHLVPRTVPEFAVQNVPVPETVVRGRRGTRPWRLVSECERGEGRAATRRGSRLIVPITPDPVEPDPEPCIAPDAPVLHDPDITYTECYDQVTFTFVDETELGGPNGIVGQTVRLETSDSPDGPWSAYAIVTENVTTFENFFAEGTFFRFSVLVEYECTDGAHEDWVAFSTPTLLESTATCPIPTLVDITNTIDSPLGLINPVVSPLDGATVSVLSDPNVGDGSFVEVRHRKQYTYLYTGPNPTAVATFSHPDGGAVIKWTRDNTRPTAATTNPSGASTGAGNPAASKHVIRARAFVGSCGSPELVIVIDVKMTLMESFLAITSNTGSWGITCDYPKDPSGEESGQSCNLLYGGTDQATAAAQGIACGLSTPAGTAHVIWKQVTSITVGNDGSGWLQHEVSVVEWRYDHCTFNRLSLAGILDAYPSGLHTYVEVDSDTGYAGTTLTGVGGVATGVQSKIDDFCIARTPTVCPLPSDGTDSIVTTSIFLTPFPPA